MRKSSEFIDKCFEIDACIVDDNDTTYSWYYGNIFAQVVEYDAGFYWENGFHSMPAQDITIKGREFLIDEVMREIEFPGLNYYGKRLIKVIIKTKLEQKLESYDYDYDDETDSFRINLRYIIDFDPNDLSTLLEEK